MMPDRANEAHWYDNIKAEFPIFQHEMNGKPLTYLDSASSAQKHQFVLDAMNDAMQTHYANIHRGLYAYSQDMTAKFEGVRGKAQRFLNAASASEIVFTRNTTEAINLVVQCWGRANLKAGDEIILTEMEHHANIVPWQILQSEIGFDIKVIPLDAKTGHLKLDALDALLSSRTRAISFVHASNVLGSVNPAKDIIARVKAYNSDIMTLLDASQSIVHSRVDVQDLDCDFLAFTGHKLYGPTGAGILYGRYDVLESMPPYQGGGDMIQSVGFGAGETTFQKPPHRFEAGTPSFIDVIGLGAAIDFVSSIGMDEIAAREAELYKQLYSVLEDYEGIIMSPGAGEAEKAPVLSFTAAWAHASDINMILDQCGVAVRTGQHCAEPLMKALGVDATMRASVGLYNDEDDIQRFADSLAKAHRMLG